MKGILAVALLDWRRLALGLVSGALIAGLVPSLASGLGGTAPANEILILTFALVGMAAGGLFGTDFADGRAAFFFARPLTAPAMILGRLSGLLALAVAALVAFMASYGLSSYRRPDFQLDVLGSVHLKVLASAWILALYLSLAVAAYSRSPRGPMGLRGALASLGRLVATLSAFIFIFGLFADLMMRAYMGTGQPARLFFTSWIVAAFVASCVAIVAGRTEQMRIARTQNRVMAAYGALCAVGVAVAWIYVLHPGPEAIRSVKWGSLASPDGRTVFVAAGVDRGHAESFWPRFTLDVASGRARLLNADPGFTPWLSPDGGTLVWSEATPFFFRPLWRLIGGSSTFRVQSQGGAEEVLPLPVSVPDGFSAADGRFRYRSVDYILPSKDGQTFAILWDNHITFSTRGGSELSSVDFGPGRRRIGGVRFAPDGALRLAQVRQDQANSILEVLRVEPHSGKLTRLTSMAVGPMVLFHFDATGERALVTSRWGASIATFRGEVSLLDLHSENRSPVTLLQGGGVAALAIFLADGRVAATANPWNSWDTGVFKTFSAEGKPLLDIAFEPGTRADVRDEMFPGLLAVRYSRTGISEDALVDANTGATVRRFTEGEPVARSWYLDLAPPPPPGSPAARLLKSRDGKLFEIPTPTAEPRLVLPRP